MCTALYSADYSCQSLVRREKRRVGGWREGGGGDPLGGNTGGCIAKP